MEIILRNTIYVSTEELPVSFGDPQPHADADRRVLVMKDDLAAELESLAKSLNRFTLRDALRWLGERNAEYRIKPDTPTPPTPSATPANPPKSTPTPAPSLQSASNA